MNKGLVIVVASPSGGGKGTILKQVMAENHNIRFSVSATTRAPREGEVDGEHYYFVTPDRFEDMLRSGEMLESTTFCDNYYGTPKEPVEKWTSTGVDVLLEIEIDGHDQVKRLMPECVTIFIIPPSLKILESRLRNRGTETEESVGKRLRRAKNEIARAVDFDYIVINDDLQRAVEDVKSILRAEKRKLYRNTELIERVLNNA